MSYGRDYGDDYSYGGGSASLQWVALACVLVLGMAVIFSFFYGKNRDQEKLRKTAQDQPFVTAPARVLTPDEQTPVVVLDDVQVRRAVPVNPVATHADTTPPLPAGVEVRQATAVTEAAIPTAPAVPIGEAGVVEVRRAQPVNP